MYIELFIYLYSTIYIDIDTMGRPCIKIEYLIYTNVYEMDRLKIYIDTMGRTCIKIEYLIYTNMYEMDRFKGNLRETIAFTVKM